MDLSNVPLMLLGYAIGVIGLPVTERACRSIAKYASPGLEDNRSQALVLLKTVAQCFVFGMLILAPLYAFGYIPLQEKFPVFAWPFMFGLITFGVRDRWKFKLAEQDRRQADATRRNGLEESISVEIAERSHDRQ